MILVRPPPPSDVNLLDWHLKLLVLRPASAKHDPCQDKHDQWATQKIEQCKAAGKAIHFCPNTSPHFSQIAPCR